MLPLKATDAISPAFARMKLVLFSPFRFGRTWKLCATAYLSRCGTVFFPFPLVGIVFFFAFPNLHDKPFVEAAIIAGIVLLSALYVWFFHVCSRLQFACFDFVVSLEKFVRPSWRRHGPHMDWTIFKIIVTGLFSLLIVTPLGLSFYHLSRSSHAHTSTTPFAIVMGSYLLFVFGFLFLLLFLSLIGDFILPSLALENTSLREAFRRFRELLRNEHGQLALYTLLKAGMAVGGTMALVIAYEVIIILVMIVLGLLGAAVGALLTHLGVPQLVLSILLGAVAVPFYVAFMGGMIFAYGIPLIFLDAYAAYFLGGRYPLLGDLLDRTLPQSPVPPQFPLQSPPDTIPSTPS